MHILSKNIQKKRSILMTQLHSLAALLLIMMGGCGTETGNPVIKRPTTPRMIAHDTVEAELMELSELGFESGSESNQLTLNLTSPLQTRVSQSDLELGLTEVSQCAVTAAGVKYSFQKSFERQRNFIKSGGSLRVSVERKLTSIWESPQNAISCKTSNELQRRPRFMEGASESRTGSFQKNIQSSGRSSKYSYSNAEFTSSGERKTVYSKVDVNTDTIVTEKTMIWNVNKTNRLNTTEGEEFYESSSVVSAENPIKMIVTRNRGINLSVISKTIKSGTAVTTRSNGNRVEINFLNLTFNAQDDCYPSSGIIRGKITNASDSASSAESFEVDFSQITSDVPEIVFPDGEKIPLNGVCFD